MSFANYTELQAAVGRWLKRNNLNDSIPDFIALAEARLNRNLRVRQMRAKYTIMPTTTQVTLPGDYQEAIRVVYGTQRLDFLSEDMADIGMTEYATNYYTITGGTLWLLTRIDGTSKLELHYYEQIPALAASNPSNWLLEDAPDVYLYAALLEAEPFLKNDGRIAVWKEALSVAINDLQRNDDAGQMSGSSLAIRSA